MLTAPAEERAEADYSFIHRTAIAVGVTQDEWSEWEEGCVHTPPAESECLRDVAP